MSQKISVAFILLICILTGIFISKYYTPAHLSASPPLSEEERSTIIKELKAFKENSQQFVKLVKLVRPSVVSISTKKVFMGYEDDFFWGFFTPRKFETSQIGSGVIVDDKGYIMTNNHVVQGADEIKVTLDDGREVIGKVIGSDSLTDIAIVKIDAKNLQPALLGDSDKIETGEMVLAIGSPFGLGQTVTSGIISAKRDSVGGNKIAGDYPGFIQTDAAINPGNSGGPLVSLSGEVIGINSVIITRSGGYQGIGFAIPINRAKYIMQQLINKGKVSRPFMGMELSAINEALARHYGVNSLDNLLKELKISKPEGVFILMVNPQSPAAEAKLQEGDIVLEYNNQKVNTPDELVNLINKSGVGDNVEVIILRDGKRKSVTVTIGERK
jgi:serine protease Do